jgi:inner membrane protein involved in colicin E2 resistance
MKDRKHGILSVLLVESSCIMAAFWLFVCNIMLGIIYCILLISLTFVVVYSYCCKCCCREKSCGHIIFGKITKILPKRMQGPYTYKDIFGVMISIGIILLFPQIWLIKNRLLFIIFWSLLILAVLEIVFFVCTKCDNSKCSLCKKKCN